MPIADSRPQSQAMKRFMSVPPEHRTMSAQYNHRTAATGPIRGARGMPRGSAMAAGFAMPEA